MVAARGEGWEHRVGEMGKGGQKAQTSSCKMHVLGMYKMVIIVHNTV